MVKMIEHNEVDGITININQGSKVAAKVSEAEHNGLEVKDDGLFSSKVLFGEEAFRLEIPVAGVSSKLPALIFRNVTTAAGTWAVATGFTLGDTEYLNGTDKVPNFTGLSLTDLREPTRTINATVSGTRGNLRLHIQAEHMHGEVVGYIRGSVKPGDRLEFNYSVQNKNELLNAIGYNTKPKFKLADETFAIVSSGSPDGVLVIEADGYGEVDTTLLVSYDSEDRDYYIDSEHESAVLSYPRGSHTSAADASVVTLSGGEVDSKAVKTIVHSSIDIRDQPALAANLSVSVNTAVEGGELIDGTVSLPAHIGNREVTVSGTGSAGREAKLRFSIHNPDGATGTESINIRVTEAESSNVTWEYQDNVLTITLTEQGEARAVFNVSVDRATIHATAGGDIAVRVTEAGGTNSTNNGADAVRYDWAELY